LFTFSCNAFIIIFNYFIRKILSCAERMRFL